MDPATASYYRALLFNDSQSENPIPKGVLEMHKVAAKGCENLRVSQPIPKHVALMVVMLWRQTTEDGREFFEEPSADSADLQSRPVRGRPRLNREPAMTAPV